jgi:hypothetical protein
MKWASLRSLVQFYIKICTSYIFVCDIEILQFFEVNIGRLFSFLFSTFCSSKNLYELQKTT